MLEMLELMGILFLMSLPLVLIPVLIIGIIIINLIEKRRDYRHGR